MLVYLLKFSACLAIFLVFYKFFLEKENMHQLKRYYLLVAILSAICIPLMAFTTYVEPIISTISQTENFQKFDISTTIVEQPINYVPNILWSIYGLGVVLFGIKFVLNLYKIIIKIKRNQKNSTPYFTYVLLKDLITPHTFFSHIFLNKQKFETHQIPKEVFIHEEAHAKQKHSIDVLLIELLQIAFWFNPLIYLMKQSIKMNHEFLADQAVLKQGFEPSTYQQILLAFSSNASEPKLANAINYPSIKKRFTVMKTHTSKQKIWLRSFLLLPLVALTLYGFSGRKEEIKPLQDLQVSNSEHTARSISIEVLEDGTYLIDGVVANKSTLVREVNKLHQDITPEIRNNIINIHVSSSSKISNEEVWFIYNSLLDYGFYRLVTPEQEVVKGKGNTPFAIEQTQENDSAKTIKGKKVTVIKGADWGDVENYMREGTQEKATPEEVAEYNKLAKNINSQDPNKTIIKQKDLERMKYLFKKMNKTQKDNSEPFPKVIPPPPPPPPAPETGFIDVNGETLFYVKFIPTEYYNKKGYKVDKNGKTVNGNIQVNASDVLPGQYITKVYQNDKVVAEFKDNGSQNIPPPPPPPPAPKSPLEHIKEMAKKGAVFYYEGKSISSDEAIQLLKKNDELNISTKQVDSKEPMVYISKAPINIKD